MAVKSVISIDVDDSDFRRFKELFDDYQTSLKATPQVWNQANTAAGGLAASSAGTAHSATQTAGAMNSVVVLQMKATQTAVAQERHWKNLARDAKTFASHIVEATRSLLRWGALTGLISGLLGGGGLFGIERLAMSAGNQRSQGLALGMKAGEAKAFETQLGGRGYDANAYLGNINKGMTDITSPQYLGMMTAGMNYQRDIKDHETADVATSYLLKLKSAVDKIPLNESFGPTAHAQRLDTIMSAEDLQRLRRTSQAEVESYAQNIRKDRTSMGLGDTTAKEWQDLKVRLSETSQALENLLIGKLVALAPSIDKLSEAFMTAVKSFLSSPQLKEWIDDLAAGIKRFADYMMTDEFQQKVTSFVLGVASIVTGIYDLVTAFGTAAKTVKDFFSGTLSLDTLKKNDEEGEPGSPEFYKKHPEYDPGDKAWHLPFGIGQGPEPPPPDPIVKQSFDRLEGERGLPPGLLNGTYQTESGGGKHLISPTGALGPFQTTTDFRKDYGITDPFDFNQSARGAADFYAKMLAKYHGDVSKAAAAYNDGPGNVDAAVTTYGSKWLEHLRPETQDYVPKVIRGLQPGMQPNGGKPTSVNININNNTGGNATVAASQLAI